MNDQEYEKRKTRLIGLAKAVNLVYPETEELEGLSKEFPETARELAKAKQTKAKKKVA